MKQMRISDPARYVIGTYLLFWCLVSLVAVGVVASGQNMALLNWMSVIPSWTPTIVLLIMFKRLFPGTTVQEWLRKAFAPRIPVGMLMLVTALMVSAILAAAFMVALQSHQPVLRLFNLSLPAIASAALFALIQGATGEEAGWRGYLQPMMEAKAGGVIPGSLYVGLIWSFWHTPLWFATGLLGWALVLYIVTFILGNLSMAVVIGVCYHRCPNLAVPMWIHFVSNFSLATYAGDPMAGRYWLVLIYLLTAAGFAYWHIASQEKQKQRPLAKGA